MELVQYGDLAVDATPQRPNTRAPHIYMGMVLDVMVVLDRLEGTPGSIEAGYGGWPGEVMAVVTHAGVGHGDPHKNFVAAEVAYVHGRRKATTCGGGEQL